MFDLLEMTTCYDTHVLHTHVLSSIKACVSEILTTHKKWRKVVCVCVCVSSPVSKGPPLSSFGFCFRAGDGDTCMVRISVPDAELTYLLSTHRLQWSTLLLFVGSMVVLMIDHKTF